MAIEINYKGRRFRADTVDEAIRLQHELESRDSNAIGAGENPDLIIESEWDHDNVMELLSGIKYQQKLFLKALFEADPIASDDARGKLKLNSEIALAGVLSGLSKQMKKMGLNPWNLYTVQVEWSGKNKKRSFHLSSGFRRAAIELGWPEKWI